MKPNLKINGGYWDGNEYRIKPNGMPTLMHYVINKRVKSYKDSILDVDVLSH